MIDWIMNHVVWVFFACGGFGTILMISSFLELSSKIAGLEDQAETLTRAVVSLEADRGRELDFLAQLNSVQGQYTKLDREVDQLKDHRCEMCRNINERIERGKGKTMVEVKDGDSFIGDCSCGGPLRIQCDRCGGGASRKC